VQLAGHTSRFAFFLRVREHTEPPEAPGAGAAKVDDAAKADAAAWQEGAVGAAAVKQDPGSLMAQLDENPALVAHLDGDELGALADANADKMSGNDFGKLMGTVGEVNPSAVAGMVDSLKKKGRLADFIGKLARDGVNLLKFLKTIKLGAVISLFKMIAGGAELLKRLQDVAEKAKIVGEKVKELDLEAELQKVQEAWEEP
jgi:hypothetical protein